jgi:hypothetical protein
VLSKGLVLGVWCCAGAVVVLNKPSKDKVQGKGAKQRLGAVWVYITSKCLVWWGRVFEIEFQFQLVLSLVLGYGAKQG